jgi:hypothetical protein
MYCDGNVEYMLMENVTSCMNNESGLLLFTSKKVGYSVFYPDYHQANANAGTPSEDKNRNE